MELDAGKADQRRTLQWVLGINFAQFAAGIAMGLWAASTALLGAALDNLSDAAVYGVSLYAVGRSLRVKVRAARLSGWLLIALAAWLLLEVTRRFFGGEPPIGVAMIAMAAVNTAVNALCLKLLARHRDDNVSFKASSIFTKNDSIVNVATVISGTLVLWLGSNVPDLALGIAVAGVCLYGGNQILQEASKTKIQSS